MADFHQQGIITTLHPLFETFDREEYLTTLEAKIKVYSESRRISLLLPCLYSEIHAGNVLSRILRELEKVDYLHSIIVALGGTSKPEDFREALEYFSVLKKEEREVKLVWVLGPRIQEIVSEIESRQIPTGVPGKGQSVWIALGYLFARADSAVISLHDCDIVTYDRVLLGRLIEPVANPNNEFEFCKGYYPRVSPTERSMKGRVTRLFVLPFVDALENIMYQRQMHDLVRFFRYHHTFKYPLAGEFSFATRLARGINIAHDWGLEVSTLSEIYNRIVQQKIAQISLTTTYEHKHQQVSPEDSQKGLHRMVVDIAKFYLNYLRRHGVALDDGFVDMISQTYYENALHFIKIYSDDAEVNDLHYDRYQEELMTRHFVDFLNGAWREIQESPSDSLIPSWNRVVYSIPEIYRRLQEAVEKDNSRP